VLPPCFFAFRRISNNRVNMQSAIKAPCRHKWQIQALVYRGESFACALGAEGE
jgi:hypothetical protein